MKARLHFRPRRSQQGIVLATALIILMVMTVLAVSMMRNFGSLERIADNTRDKQRAFNAAQNTLQYAEWWLTQGNGGAGSACTTLLDSTSTAAATMARVCSNALVSNTATSTQAVVSVVPWKTSGGTELGVNYTPPNMTVSTAGSANQYAANPRWYVTSLGIDPTATLQLYQVSAMGQGGGADAVAVVQSVYALKSDIIDAGGL